MKRLATVLFLTALIVSSIFSRSSGDKYVGLSAGYVYSTINTETGYKTGQSYLPGNGFSISVPVVIQVHDNIGVETGVDFIQKRFTSRYLSVSLSDADETYERNTNNYVELPLAISLSLRQNNLSFGFGFGGYCGFWLSSYREGKAYGSSENLSGTAGVFEYYSGYHEFNERYDNRYGFGLLFRGGMEYQVENVVMMLRLTYRLGISDMRKGQKYYNTKMRNNALVAEIGVLYNFGGAR